MKRLILLSILLCSSIYFVIGQSDNRLAQGLNPIEFLPKFNLPSQNNKTLITNELEARVPGRAPKYAVNLPVNITPDNNGNWEYTAAGEAVWRMVIQSSNAHCINLGFTKYLMPKNGKLFLYSSNYEEVFGPFTPADNEEHEQLWTPNVKGDEIVIEVQLPISEIPNLQLELSFVNHAFQKFSSGALLSGSCNLDVICGTADGWGIVEPHRDIIQSVAVISTGGGTFCTGFLISNANQDCTPYFMTADHCGIGAGNAPSLVTYWNFFNSTCRQPNSAASGQNGNGSLADFNTGAIFRATSAASDFTIVELDDPVSETANAYFAGYDASGSAISSAIAVHHPSTDEKRISFENDPLTFTTYSGTAPTANYSHVRVIDWDTGTTEPGSSGSPLFDQDERIVGQLHGGGAACGNNQSDWYGSLAVSWEGGGSSSSRLKDWLDPNNTGTLVNNGYYANACSFSIISNPSAQTICAPNSTSYSLTVSSSFASNVSLSTENLPAGLSASFSPSSPAPGSTATLTISNTSAATPGTYNFNIIGNSGGNTSSNALAITILAGAPGIPSYVSPSNGEMGTSLSPTLSWNGTAGVDYFVEISSTPNFSNIIESGTVNSNNYSPSSASASLTTYYWRVSGSNFCGSSSNGPSWSFTTANISCLTVNASNLGLSIGPNAGTTTTSSLNISDNVTVADLNINGISINHTWVRDLDIYLTSPANTQVQLLEQVCNDDDDVMLSFSDQTGNDYGSIPCPPTNGNTYQPLEALSSFNGENAQGNWELSVTDNFDDDGGTLNDWSIEICFIETFAALTATASVLENNECFGEEEGAIEVLATGGVLPYMYSIDGVNFQLDALFEELATGTYTIIVTDAAGDQAILNGNTITSPSTLNANANINGSTATINSSGGTSPYSYSLDGIDFQTSNVFNNLANGTYNVEVEDLNGCATDAPFTISVNTLEVSTTFEDILCFGQNNGAIIVNASGGKQPYSYSINGGTSQNSNVFSNLSSGTYQIVVTDDENFTISTQTIIISSPPSLNISASVSGFDIIANGNGGTGSLMYSLNGVNFQSGNEFPNQANGNYTVFVQDENGCLNSTNVVVNNNPLTITSFNSNIDCFGNNNGTIEVFVTGGAAPYSYSINNLASQSSNIFTNLSPGTYSVEATDNDGFQITSETIIITSPTVLTISASVTDNNIILAGNGGAGSLTYSINGGNYQSNNTFTNVPNGTYTVYVQDQNGCISTTMVVVQFNIISATITIDRITCFEEENGIITVTAVGGQPPYEYSINGNTPQTSNVFNSLGEGTYQIEVNDNQGNSFTIPATTLQNPDELTLVTTITENSVLAEGNGGTDGLTYSINGTDYQNSGEFTNLENGIYTVYVQDENGCIVTTEIIIAVNGLIVSATATDISCHDENNGSITVSANGGLEPYMFSIDGSTFQESNIFDNLQEGTYEVVVQDADGFTMVTSAVSISNPNEIVLEVTSNENNISASAEGGIGSLSYSINGTDYQNSGEFTNLENGIYTVYVQDENGCIVTTEIIIAVNGLIVSATATDISCHDENDGSITVSANGGLEPYMFSTDGSTFQESNIFDNLQEGTYEVVVQDADGFTMVTSAVSISNPNEIVLEVTSNENNISASAEGGIGSLSYSINGTDYQNSGEFTNLENGIYTVYVQDENGCIVTTEIIIAVNGLIVSATATDISCHDENNGSITVSANGGLEPYMFSIDGSTFQESNVFDNLQEGTYEVVVQDADGFTMVTSAVSISNPNEIVLEVTSNENNISASAEGGIGSLSYSINGTDYQNSGEFTNLENGIYTVYVQDENGCIVTTEIIIAVNGLIVSATATDISCHDENNGSITVSANGGLEPYMFSIDGSTFQESNVFDNLQEGTYEVVVQDADGFTMVTSAVSISNPNEINISTSTTENSILVNAVGGIGILQYSLDGINFQNSNVFTDLASGVYMIFVQDENDCIISSQAIISNSSMVATAFLVNNISCFGGNNGSIVVEVGNGSFPYQYSIDGGETFQEVSVFTDLAIGEYQVLVQDSNGNMAFTNTISLIQPTQLEATTTTGINSILVEASGGIPLYSYSINGSLFSSNNEFLNLESGIYNIMIQDENGCEITVTEEIAIPNLIGVSIIEEEITCFEGENGVIAISTEGGIPPYVYSLNDAEFQESNVFFNLNSGTYFISIMDAVGTITTIETTLTHPEDIEITTSITGNTVEVNATGGVGSYTYSIDGINFSENNVFNNLSDDEYIAYVQDENGCLQEVGFSLVSNTISASINLFSEITCADDSDGIIEVSVTGGYPPYSYSLDGDNFQESNLFDGLSSGIYEVTIMDSEGFTFTTMSITLTNPPLLSVGIQTITSTVIGTGSGGIMPYEFSIDGQNYQEIGTFNDLENGNYLMYIRDANGCVISMEFKIETVGINSIENQIDFLVYPNPNNGTFQIELENDINGVLNLDIYNVVGQKIYQEEWSKTGDFLQRSISIDDLAAGTYQVVVRHGNFLGRRVLVVL